jgi:hypothetical protein
LRLVSREIQRRLRAPPHPGTPLQTSTRRYPWSARSGNPWSARSGAHSGLGSSGESGGAYRPPSRGQMAGRRVYEARGSPGLPCSRTFEARACGCVLAMRASEARACTWPLSIRACEARASRGGTIHPRLRSSRVRVRTIHPRLRSSRVRVRTIHARLRSSRVHVVAIHPRQESSGAHVSWPPMPPTLSKNPIPSSSAGRRLERSDRVGRHPQPPRASRVPRSSRVVHSDPGHPTIVSPRVTRVAAQGGPSPDRELQTSTRRNPWSARSGASRVHPGHPSQEPGMVRAPALLWVSMGRLPIG